MKSEYLLIVLFFFTLNCCGVANHEKISDEDTLNSIEDTMISKEDSFEYDTSIWHVPDKQYDQAIIDSLIKNFKENTKRNLIIAHKKYLTVKQAYSDKKDTLKYLLAINNIGTFNIDLFLRIFKKEEEMEVWAKEKGKDTFIHLKTYYFCTSSGTLGPKREEWDNQIPEGFYKIVYFNPTSSFFLSLKINYPNKSDRILTTNRNRPGGNICIHGDCASIGCIPIYDEGIKEVYLLALEANSDGKSKIYTHIFPARLDNENFNNLLSEYPDSSGLINFWQNLKEGFDLFENNKQIPNVSVASDGKYIFIR